MISRQSKDPFGPEADASRRRARERLYLKDNGEPMPPWDGEHFPPLPRAPIEYNEYVKGLRRSLSSSKRRTSCGLFDNLNAWPHLDTEMLKGVKDIVDRKGIFGTMSHSVVIDDGRLTFDKTETIGCQIRDAIVEYSEGFRYGAYERVVLIDPQDRRQGIAVGGKPAAGILDVEPIRPPPQTTERAKQRSAFEHLGLRKPSRPNHAYAHRCAQARLLLPVLYGAFRRAGKSHRVTVPLDGLAAACYGGEFPEDAPTKVLSLLRLLKTLEVSVVRFERDSWHPDICSCGGAISGSEMSGPSSFSVEMNPDFIRFLANWLEPSPS